MIGQASFLIFRKGVDMVILCVSMMLHVFYSLAFFILLLGKMKAFGMR
jgi:hypothetical protein